jgi:hypothetical protein
MIIKSPPPVRRRFRFARNFARDVSIPWALLLGLAERENHTLEKGSAPGVYRLLATPRS